MKELRPDEIFIFQDEAGEWRWRKIAPNGEIVATSGESYTRKDDVIQAAEREASGPVAVIEEQDYSA